ncbi:MAG: leucine--tRNA ligase [Candidatus Paceibacterota bacterium]
MMPYDPEKIEKKWQAIWEKTGIFHAKENKEKKKFYGLVEFPYPSGDGLHTGHPRSYTAMDIICRKRRMEGYSVLYPIGFDSFGLPTENYAIKRKVNPKIITKENIAIFTRQLKSLGFSFDWSRVLSTSDPEYYKWTQWIFLQLFKHGLAYKAKENINWCTSCKIGLANEEVVGGVCERCGSEVIKKEREQWILKITKYADRLIDDLKNVDYLDRIKNQQINWIGRSEGASIKFEIRNQKSETISNNLNPNDQNYLEVFTTRADTIFGATFLVIAPDHSLIVNSESLIENYEEIEKYISDIKKASPRLVNLGLKKTGVEIKGIKAINPATKKEIPVFIADYVSMDYGTGAIMAVPGHDTRDYAFAKRYNLPIEIVVKPTDDLKSEIRNPKSETNSKFKIQNSNFAESEAYEGDGININSGFLNGLETKEAQKKIIAWLKENKLGDKTINYHLRDWIFSRQRYWGEPIPLIFCPKCKKLMENTKYEIRNTKHNEGEILNPGWVAVPEKDLPIELPEIKDFIPTKDGDSPLAKAKDWVKVKCPKCGCEARRETDVMPNWAGSNWYYIAYTISENSKFEIRNTKQMKYWTPVDWYNGGMEHTTLHLLYSRFIYKFLYDIGAVPRECGPEPYKKRTAHGMILGEGGIKMSKSKGNVINPDDYVKEYGADTVRLYEMFMGPFDQAIPWEGKSVIGVNRFLSRVWDLGESVKLKAKSEKHGSKIQGQESKDLERLLNQTIKKVGEDIEQMKFNTAVSQMMIFLNEIEKAKDLAQEVFEKFLIILSPFAPHITEELYQLLKSEIRNPKSETNSNFRSISEEPWPKYDEKLIKKDVFSLVVQVNGKVREMIECPIGISESEAKEKALSSSKIIGWTRDKEIVKVIYVQDKLINFVVK